MKVIIMVAGKEDQFWLHINKIKRIYAYEFNDRYIRTEIHLEDNYKIEIIDRHKNLDFKKFVYDFINSEEEIQFLKITEFQYNANWCKMETTDWVAQVVTQRSKNG